MTEFRDLLASLVAHLKTLTQDLLPAVDNNELSQRYGPAVSGPMRLECLEKWKAEPLALIARFRVDTIPVIAKKSTQEVTRVLTAIHRGVAPDARKPTAPRPPDSMTEQQAILWAEQQRQNLNLADKLDELIFLQRVAIAVPLNNMATTEVLDDRCGAYLSSARDGDLFDYRQFALDKISLPPILAAREAAGDPRARFALEKIVQTQTALARRAVPDSDTTGEESAALQDLGHVQKLIENVAVGNHENLKPLSDFLGMIDRSLDRTAEAATIAAKPNIPKQRGPEIEAAVRRIALAQANAQPSDPVAIGNAR